MTQTVPVRRRSATRTARAESRLHPARARPYRESLATATAWSSSSTGMTVRTGPKISSWAMREAGSAPVKMVGAK